MAGQRGQHFDPDLLDVFLEHYGSFCDIARRYPDEADPAVRADIAPDAVRSRAAV